ncbi:MAG: SDR family oxidoreductase [Phycisphaeraceae bacterium]|nr:SDR family oxidoreductase [Phycisphaeraceae bacterium]
MPTSPTVVILTGAGGGVGQAAALALAHAGCDLLLTSRDPRKLQAAADAVGEANSRNVHVETFTADLSQPNTAPAVVEACLKHFGRVDVLAHVAGYAPNGPIDQITPEQWRATIDVNLTSLVLLTAAVWPVFRRQKKGLIVSVSSIASLDPFPGFSMYAPAKAGVNMFTLCAGREGAEFGIRAVAIAPGAIETPMLRKIYSEQDIPRDRTLRPEAVAEMIRDCVTGARDFESGQTTPLPSP